MWFESKNQNKGANAVVIHISIPIGFLFFALFPIRDPWLWRFKKLYRFQRLCHIVVCLVTILLQIIFWDKQPTQNIITAVFLTIIIVLPSALSFFAYKKSYKILTDRILSISDYNTLSAGDIRKALLLKYDEAYSTDEIKKVIKKLA